MLKTTNYGVVILISGPAGLQAAIHAARRKVSVLLLGKDTQSSPFHAHIENFCCLFNVKGKDMLNAGRRRYLRPPHGRWPKLLAKAAWPVSGRQPMPAN